jgi:DNA-binding GntR family transcriptional regulator
MKTPVPTTTFQETAYTYIKSQILNLGFKPGEYLTDLQISGLLNISRTPVREAFRMIEQEGLLIYEARRGWKVYTLTLDDVNEIFEIKITLEGQLSRKAAQCTNQDLRNKLQEIINSMRKAADANDVESWIAIDTDIHHTIYLMAHNQRALQIIENLNDQWNRLRTGFSARTGRINRSIIEHEALVRAILDGDGESAEKCTQEHLRNVQDELVNTLIHMVLPFAQNGV